ncbi:MAG: hypothetical protein GIW95_05435 [Candidatus Eremiobacteraeota bacterium]|nr:hypothetical protein [Candidatus Eremiobacteraeota bacterium]
MKIARSFRAGIAVSLVAVALLFAAAKPAEAFLDKTRFAAHLGIAYFCFHHWVLKPYEEQQFAPGAPHRTATIVKGGAALLFAVHEVRVSSKIAHLSKDPFLQKIAGNVDALTGSFGAVGQKLKSGQFNPDDIKSLLSSTTSLGSAAAAGGAPIKDIPVALPGK